MPYVDRDQSGTITSVYASPQPGLSLEEVPETDPGVQAIRNPPRPPPENTPATGDDVIATLKLLNLPGASAAQIDAALTTAKRNRP